MITYVFAPVGYVGTFRTLKYCKYLPALGWDPVVLTIDPRNVPHKDARLLAQMPAGAPIYRTLDIDPAKWLRARGMRKLRAAAARGETVPTDASEGPVPQRPGLFKRFKQLVNAMLTDSPDSHIFWVPFAVAKGLRVIRRERIDVVYCSAPPHSSHVIAYLLGKLTGRPYVLDFRDPWVTDKRDQSPAAYYRFLSAAERWLKRVVVRSAALVIAATEGERNELYDELPGLDGQRLTHITNGFDPSDFEGLAPSGARRSKLVLTHSGTIYPRIADELFDALEHLVAHEPDIGRRIEVNLMGDVVYDYQPRVDALAAAGVLRAHGLKTQSEAIQMLLDSDVLLILRGARGHFPPSHIPAKIFEYIHVGKPILSVAADGELAKIARRSGLGIIVPPGEPLALAEQIQALAARHVEHGLEAAPDRGYIDGFHRRALAATLAERLAEVG
jgi:glycosyltransferase involved in cell wall biosynthesis